MNLEAGWILFLELGYIIIDLVIYEIAFRPCTLREPYLFRAL